MALTVKSSRNLGCLPRWQLAALADTEFVCSMDDDLLLKDKRVIEDAVGACRERCPDGIVGFFGWEHVDGKPYKRARHINGSRKDRRCDIVKGRFMLLRRKLLSSVPMLPPDMDGERLGFRCDDIYVSLCIARGEWGRHLVPGVLRKRWKELPQRGASLAAQPGHYEQRDRAVSRIRQWLREERP